MTRDVSSGIGVGFCLYSYTLATLKRILEQAVPKTLQDVVLIYASVTGKREEGLFEENYVNTIHLGGEALKDRDGKKLLHQRCPIHKDRNIQRHWPKHWRKEAHRRFHIALEQPSDTEAKAMLTELACWLRPLNESAADSLREACEELLTVHRWKVPALLRKTLHTTNPLESMFSTVRECEGTIKRYRGSTMAQRWWAAGCLHGEQGVQTVKGFRESAEVISHIEAEQAAVPKEQVAA